MSDNEYSEFKEFLFRNFLETEKGEHVLVERIQDYVYNTGINDKEEEFQEIVAGVFHLCNTGFSRFIDLAYLLNIPAVFAETKQLGVWYMKNIQKRTNKEIASLMKVTESTIRDQYRLAEKQLEREAERTKIYETLHEMNLDGTLFFNCSEKDVPAEAEINDDPLYEYKYKIVFEQPYDEPCNCEQCIKQAVIDFLPKSVRKYRFVETR